MHSPKSLLYLVLLLSLAACGGRPATPASPEARETPQTAASLPDLAQLSVEASPAGAAVAIDGEPHGVSPLALSLPAGQHQISLSAEGYAPLTETVELVAGKEAIYAPSLRDLAPPSVRLASDRMQVPWLGKTVVRASATDNVGVTELQLWSGEQQLATAAGGELEYELAPADETDMSPGSAYALTARAVDAAGNVGEASLVLQIEVPPAPTRQPSPQARPATATGAPARISTGTPTVATMPAATVVASTEPVSPAGWPSDAGATSAGRPPETPSVAAGGLGGSTAFSVNQITISTYPYADYVSMAEDPNMGHYPVQVLDRSAYEASNPRPLPKTYKLVVLENAYLRLGILPELGGRVYQVVFKPTGNDELYRNPVIKPTQWGPASPPAPAGANWWLAAGGIEWGFPVSEHGYEWATRWGYDYVPTSGGGIMVSLFTRDPKRPYVVVDIIVPPDTAYFIVRPRITNAPGSTFRFQWWANAMLAPGAANKPGSNLRFIFPAEEMTVHSTGDATLPGPGQPFSWPIYNGRDLSRLGNWSEWLGFFERPAAQGNFSGVYDGAADEGMIRAYPSDVVHGTKGFGVGWTDPIDWHVWTDDGSSYVEMQGGLSPTFDDWYELPPGGEITWEETWYPVAGIGGVTYAGAAGAIHLAPVSGGLRVGAFPTSAVQGQLTVSLPGMEPVVRQVNIDPATPFNEVIPYSGLVPPQGEVSVVLTGKDGRTLLSYRGKVVSR